MGTEEAVWLARQGRLAEAEAAAQRHLQSHPSDPDALHLLGTVLHRLGRHADAAEQMERAVALAPAVPHYRVNLAAALGSAGRPQEAIPHLREALRIGGSVPELENNLGVTLEKLNRFGEAVVAYRRAIAMRPSWAEAHHNLGNALRKSGRVAESAAAYAEAVRLRPGYEKALGGLAAQLTELGDLPGSMDSFRRLVELKPEAPGPRSSLLYVLHYDPACGAQRLWEEHRQWGRIFCDPKARQNKPHVNDPTPNRRLRVGYVSPDFREQTVPYFITAALRYHDRARYEVFCYSDVEKPDAVTERLKGMAEHWHENRGQSHEAVAAQIRDDQIDILVDLRGHAAGNRLVMFCLKPAPVQVNMVGYFNTTGLSTMDYRITDDLQDPPGQTESYHTETLVRLAGSCWCYTADEDAPDVSEPPAMKNGYIAFGSLNKIIKVSEPCARLWAGVLEAVPGSKLLLSVAAADAGGVVRKRLASYGLPSDRLVIVDKTRSRREYLSRFGQIDIALDTWPFNGITTTCDGLWMGVPCVSMMGGTSVSRAGKSILHAAGLEELATESPDAFVRAAADLACDTDRLRELRRSMRDRLLASILMDHRGFARKLEAAYRTMWRAWCAGRGA